MAYQMLIGSAFQTTLEIFHQIFQIFLRDLHIGSTEQQGVRTRQSGKRTVKFSKIDKQPEQSKQVETRTVQKDRIVRTAVYDLDYNFQNSGDSVLLFRFLGHHSPFGYRQIRYNSFLLFYPNQISTKHSCRQNEHF